MEIRGLARGPQLMEIQGSAGDPLPNGGLLTEDNPLRYSHSGSPASSMVSADGNSIMRLGLSAEPGDHAWPGFFSRWRFINTIMCSARNDT